MLLEPKPASKQLDTLKPAEVVLKVCEDVGLGRFKFDGKGTKMNICGPRVHLSDMRSDIVAAVLKERRTPLRCIAATSFQAQQT